MNLQCLSQICYPVTVILHISQFNNDTSPHSIWCEILAEVQNFNQNAGTITLDTLPDDLVEYFKPKARDHIPEELTKENVEGDREAQPATDWGHHTAAQKLALAALIGSWNEGNEADIKVVTQIVGEDYSNWITNSLKVSK
jgi:hypothetical protein